MEARIFELDKLKGAETNLYTFRYWLFSEIKQNCFRTLYHYCQPRVILNFDVCYFWLSLLRIEILNILFRNEFLFSDGRKVSDAEHKRKLKRRKSILEMIVKLQEQIQHSLPVVGRFLTDYLEHWDGKTHFPQFVNLISQLQLTDYKELHDCIISPIMNKHFQTFSTYKRLVFISNLHKLLRLIK